MDILDDMGVSKLSAKVFYLFFFYSFNTQINTSHPNLYSTFNKVDCFETALQRYTFNLR